jgi:AbrB family looped-hinge helix DNA binding protein
MQTSNVHTRMNTGFLIETTKGQITIPADVRNTLKLDAGYRVKFVQIAPDRFEFVAANRSITELKGLFGKPSKRG